MQYPDNPQDYNPYSYVGNNPLTYTDPTGFDWKISCNQSGCKLVVTGNDNLSGPGSMFIDGCLGECLPNGTYNILGGPAGIPEGSNGANWMWQGQVYDANGVSQGSIVGFFGDQAGNGGSLSLGSFYAVGGSLLSGDSMAGIMDISLGGVAIHPITLSVGAVLRAAQPEASQVSTQQTNPSISKKGCMASAAHPVTGSAAFKLGLFGKFDVDIGGGLKANVDLNLWTLNIGKGVSLVSQGASLGVTLFGRSLGLGAERYKEFSTYGPWTHWQGYGSADPLQGSAEDGLSLGFDIGLGIGAEASVSHLETALACSIPAAQ